MRASDINDFVRGDLERVRGSKPGATTLYRYRSTLHRLRLMGKEGRLWRVEVGDPIVRTLVASRPGNGASLAAEARVPFAEAVLRHEDCRVLLLDLFMSERGSAVDFETFCTQSAPVVWRHSRSDKIPRLEMWNRQTGQQWCYEHKQAVLAVLYGVRYWLRDELGVVDEYAELGENAVMLFAVYPMPEEQGARKAQVLEAVRFILAARSGGQWTTLGVADLIRRYCVERRQARRVLFEGFDWLCRHRARSVALVPTPVAVATLSSSNASREHFELGRYYRDVRGRLIGDVRIHANAEMP